MKIHGADLHEGQRKVVDKILAGHKYIVVNSGRQVGKSFLSQQVICYWALNNPNAVILVVAPVYAQLRRPFEEIIDGLHGANVIESANKSEFIIRFKNGSKVIFKSAERPDSMRGLTADFAVLDEAAYMQDDVWRAVIKPILLIKGKQILFISTPRSRNWFYDIYQLGQSEDHPEYVSVTMTYDENPFVNIQEIAEAKATLPDHIFRSEYMAEFTESGATVFTNLDNCSVAKWPVPSGRTYLGVDLGRQNDYTVATVIDDAGQVLEIYRDNQKEWHLMLENVIKLARKYNSSILVEANSIGDVVYDLLKKQWPRTEAFNTTSQSKQQIIEALIIAFNKAELKIPSRELFGALRFELDVFEYQYSPSSRSVRYSAPNGMHDDCVMSLAIANRARQQMKTSGQYVVGGKQLRN